MLRLFLRQMIRSSFYFILLGIQFPSQSFAVGYEEFEGKIKYEGKEGGANPVIPLPSSGPLSPGEPPEISKGHKKALEVDSLMGGFITEKINEIQTINLIYSGDEKEDKLLDLLGSYCFKTVEAKGSQKALPAESGKQCANRYILSHKPFLYGLKGAMGHSDNEIAKLKCTSFDEKGICKFQPSPHVVRESKDGNFVPEKPSYTYIPTYKELQAYSKRAGIPKSQKISPQDYDNWIKSIHTEPPREKFVKYRTIPRDPEDPQSGVFTIVDTTPDGKVKYDEESYKIAYEDWKISSQALRQSLSERGPGVMEEMNAASRASREEFLNDTENKDTRQPFSNYNAYAQGRGELVGTTNQLIATPVKKNNLKAGKVAINPVGNPSEKNPTGLKKNENLDPRGKYDGTEVLRSKGTGNGDASSTYSLDSFDAKSMNQLTRPLDYIQIPSDSEFTP